MYDVLVIGAGVSGSLIARELCRYRLSVCLVDRGHDAASGASKANSGIVHAGYDAVPGTLKAKLNVQGCLMMPEVTRQLDVAYRKLPSLVVCYREEDRPKLDELYGQGVANGVKNLKLIGKEEIKELEPNVTDKAIAALYAGDAGIVCPYNLAIGAAENAVANGADCFFNYEVRSIEEKDGYYAVSDGKKELDAKYVVNAAGERADEVAKLTDDCDFEIRPRRGEYLLFDKKVSDCVKHIIFGTPSKAGKGILVTPTVDGNMIAGPNAHEVEKEDTSVTQPGMDEIYAGASELVPSLPSTRNVITSFAGVRATPATGDFIIRMSKKHGGILLVAGIESPGLTSSPAIAVYAVEILKKAGLKLEKNESFKPCRRSPSWFGRLGEEEKQKVIKEHPEFGKIVCRCETISEGEILDAINRPMGATSVDGVKKRIRAGMGRCQGGFCSPRVAELISGAKKIPLDEVTKCGGDSKLLYGRTK